MEILLKVSTISPHNFMVSLHSTISDRIVIRQQEARISEEEQSFLDRFHQKSVGTLPMEELEKATDLLSQIAFPDEIWSTILSHLAEVERTDTSKRIKIRFLIEPPDLHAWCWESLLLPSQKSYSRRLPRSLVDFYRVTTGEEIIPSIATGAQLRIAIILGEAQKPEILEAQNEFKALGEAINSLEASIKLTMLEAPSRKKLLKTLTKSDGFHIIHFIGNAVLREGNPHLALSSTKEKEAISIDEFSNAIEDKDTRFVILSSVTATRHFAPVLAGRDMTAVLGMQFSAKDLIPVKTILRFYKEILKYKSLSVCVHLLRRNLIEDREHRLSDTRFCTPVLYLNVADDCLFESPEVSALKRYTGDFLEQFKYFPSHEEEKRIETDKGYVPLNLGREATKKEEPGREEGEPPSETRRRESRQRVWWDHGERHVYPEMEDLDVDEAMNKRRIVILGDPGAGKTSFLMHQAFTHMRRLEQHGEGSLLTARVPFFIPFKDWDGKNFLSHLSNLSGIESTIIKQWAEEGRLIFLMDALDEINAKERKDYIATIEKLAFIDFGRCTFIVSSRASGYRNALPNFNILYIQRLGEREIRLFVQRYFSHSESRTEQFITTLRKIPSMRALAGNPLLLKIMAQVFQRNRFIMPDNRVDLYRRASFQILARLGLDKRQLTFAMDILSDIALKLFEKDEAYLNTEMVKSFIHNAMKTSESDNWKADAERLQLGFTWSGILEKRGKARYTFIHPTFQEFFTARALVTMDDGIKYLMVDERIRNPRWREVILLVAAMMNDATLLVKAIPIKKDDLHNQMLSLAALCCLNAKNMSTSIQSDLSVRVYARWQGMCLGKDWIDESALQLCTRLIIDKTFLDKDKPWNVRTMAAKVLGKLGDPQAIDALIQGLLDEDEYVREMSSYALGRIGDSQAIEPLIYALRDRQWAVRESAAYALGEIGGAQAIDALISALKGDNRNVLRRSSYALGRIGDPRAVQALAKALQNDDRLVREMAADALGKIGNVQTVGVLANALGDKFRDVRKTAAFALGELGDQTAIDALRKRLQDKNEDFWVRKTAAFALGKIGDPQAVEALIHVLKDKVWRVRNEAVKALGKIGNPQAVDVLIEALDDEVREVLIGAAYALGKIGSPRAIDALIDALNDEDSWVRRRAVDALDKIGGNKVVEALVKALDDEDSWVRRRAADSLGEIGDRQAVKALIQALTHEDSWVRWRAAHALGKIGDPKSVDALIEIKKDPEQYVRMSAAGALGKINNPKSVDALIDALRDKKQYVRLSAAEALGNIANEKAVKALFEALQRRIDSSDVLWKALSNASEKAGLIIMPNGAIKKILESNE